MKRSSDVEGDPRLISNRSTHDPVDLANSDFFDVRDGKERARNFLPEDSGHLETFLLLVEESRVES